MTRNAVHYLRSGSGDIAKLDFQARSFDAYLDSKTDEAKLLVDDSIEDRLRDLARTPRERRTRPQHRNEEGTARLDVPSRPIEGEP